MNVMIYARVSTDDKDQNPERQIAPCKNYCELHNHKILEVITEHQTGDSDPFKRPEGSKLLNSNCQGIVVYSMDRFTRQHPIKVFQMLNSLKDRGVKIISITEPAFNMESEFSEIIIYLMSWFNNYFLTKLRRDVRSGIERARRQGKQIGRSKKNFNEFRAAELLGQGLSYGAVSKELGVSKATIYRRFKNL